MIFRLLGVVKLSFLMIGFDFETKFLLLFSLKLNDNNICQVEKSAFEDTSSLHSLSLSNNRITRLHQSTFEKIQDHIARLEISGKSSALRTHLC